MSMRQKRQLTGVAFLAALSGISSAQGLDSFEEPGTYDLYRREPGYFWSLDHPSNRGTLSSPATGLRDGELRFHARYQTSNGSGLRDRTSRLSEAEGFARFGYEYVPTDQQNDTTSFELGYGLSENLTLAVEVPFFDRTWDNVTSGGEAFRQTSSGIGDVQIWAHNKWFSWGSEQAFWSAGLEIPTGSFDETDNRPGAAAPVVLPYQMQLGSGTWDLTGRMAWFGYDGAWSWGGSLQQTWRLFGPNDRDYTLGSYGEIAFWGGRKLTESILTTVRIQFLRQGDIRGADPALSRSRSPSEHPDQQKVKRLDLLLGLTWFQGTGSLEGLWFGLEGGIPLFQQLRGPQIENDYFAGIGLQWTF